LLNDQKKQVRGKIVVGGSLKVGYYLEVDGKTFVIQDKRKEKEGYFSPLPLVLALLVLASLPLALPLPLSLLIYCTFFLFSRRPLPITPFSMGPSGGRLPRK
jgi:hypothetical protein